MPRARAEGGADTSCVPLTWDDSAAPLAISRVSTRAIDGTSYVYDAALAVVVPLYDGGVVAAFAAGPAERTPAGNRDDAAHQPSHDPGQLRHETQPPGQCAMPPPGRHTIRSPAAVVSVHASNCSSGSDCNRCPFAK